jgi:hypothetical protein
MLTYFVQRALVALVELGGQFRVGHATGAVAECSEHIVFDGHLVTSALT